MRTLVTGAYGQLGKEINRQFENIDNIELISTGKKELNVTDIFAYSNININIEPYTSKDFIQFAKRPSCPAFKKKNSIVKFNNTFSERQVALNSYAKGVNL
jgi:hypothetical protein